MTEVLERAAAVAPMTNEQIVDALMDRLTVMPRLGNLRPNNWSMPRRAAVKATVAWALAGHPEILNDPIPYTADQIGAQFVAHFNDVVAAGSRFNNDATQATLGRWVLEMVPEIRAMKAGTEGTDSVPQDPFTEGAMWRVLRDNAYNAQVRAGDTFPFLRLGSSAGEREDEVLQVARPNGTGRWFFRYAGDTIDVEPVRKVDIFAEGATWRVLTHNPNGARVDAGTIVTLRHKGNRGGGNQDTRITVLNPLYPEDTLVFRYAGDVIDVEPVEGAVPKAKVENPWAKGTEYIVAADGVGNSFGMGLDEGTMVYITKEYGATEPNVVYFATTKDEAERGQFYGYTGKDHLIPADPETVERMKREREEREAREKAEMEAAGPFAVGGIARDKNGKRYYRLVFDYGTADEHYRRSGYGRDAGTWEVDQVDPVTRRSLANHSTQRLAKDLVMVQAPPQMVWPTIESMSEGDPDDVDGLREALRQARQDHLDDIADLSARLAEWAVKSGYCPTYDSRMLDSAVGMKVPLAPRQANHVIDMVDRYVVEVPRRVEVQAANMTAAIAAAKGQPTRHAPDLSADITERLTRNLKNVREGIKVERTGEVDARPSTT